MTNKTAIMPTYYSQMQVAFAYGRGVWLWDTDGNKYLDALSGIAVCSLGHAHSKITAAIIQQAKKLLHTSNTYRIINQEKLAEKLVAVANMEQAYFCNSGAEANEAAIKLTRSYARKKNIAEPIVITMKNSFHGRTMGALSASGTERIQIGFEPLLSGFKYVAYNDIAELKQLVKENSNIIAIMLEPIQGDGGIQIASEEYLNTVRQLCDKYDLLMIVDEVQTGIGRTGKWFCHQHFNVIPDIITCAKALGNGLPIGACLARGKGCNLFGPGKHGTTFGGTPIVCAAALAVLETIENEKLLQNATEIGVYLQNKLKKVLKDKVVDVRGRGLMIGVELSKDCMPIVQIGLKYGLLFNITSNRVIRLLPPLILKKSHADEIAKRLVLSIDEFMG